jgi:hypothetical protein
MRLSRMLPRRDGRTAWTMPGNGADHLIDHTRPYPPNDSEFDKLTQVLTQLKAAPDAVNRIAKTLKPRYAPAHTTSRRARGPAVDSPVFPG